MDTPRWTFREMTARAVLFAVIVWLGTALTAPLIGSTLTGGKLLP